MFVGFFHSGLSFNVRPVNPIISLCSFGLTINEQSTSPLPVESIASITLTFPSEVLPNVETSKPVSKMATVLKGELREL